MTLGLVATVVVSVVFGAGLLTGVGLWCYNLGKRERGVAVRLRPKKMPTGEVGDPVRPGRVDDEFDVRRTR